MKLISLLALTIFTYNSYAVSCRYSYKSDNMVEASCKMVVEGHTYHAKGIGRSQMTSMARSEACMNCRVALPQKMPKELQDKYRNSDGSFTLTRNGLAKPQQSGAQRRVSQQPVGEQSSATLECRRIKKYIYCSDSNWYAPVSAEKNSKLNAIMKWILNSSRNQVKRIPGPSDDGDGESPLGFEK
jgi:hypothetical protein